MLNRFNVRNNWIVSLILLSLLSVSAFQCYSRDSRATKITKGLTHCNNLDLCVPWSCFLTVYACVSSASRARLRALPYGGKHLHRLHCGRLSRRSLLLHLPEAQAADAAAHPSLPAQLPRRDHPHDPHHRSAEPPRSVATVQHSHHQLQLGRRQQLHAEVFSRRSGAARLPGVCHRILVSLHPHPDPSNSTPTPTSPLYIPTHIRRHTAPAAPHPHPAAAPPALHALSPLTECRVPPAPAVLLPPAAGRFHSSKELRWLRTELTGLSRRSRGGSRFLDGAKYEHAAADVWVGAGWRGTETNMMDMTKLPWLRNVSWHTHQFSRLQSFESCALLYHVNRTSLHPFNFLYLLFLAVTDEHCYIIRNIDI